MFHFSKQVCGTWYTPKPYSKLIYNHLNHFIMYHFQFTVVMWRLQLQDCHGTHKKCLNHSDILHYKVLECTMYH